MADSVFTKIIKGEIPAEKVYEDDKTIAFIPLHIIGKATILVVPKIEIDQFMDLPDDYYQATMATVKKVARRLREVYATKRVGVHIEGLDVSHAHVKVFAFDTNTEFHNETDKSDDPHFLADMGKKLAF
jgi:histidine triad (HIT) family protein